MKTVEIIRRIDLGNSVAEFDEELEKYFVETEPFRALVEGRADVVAGDKGTGKTALYRILQRRYGSFAELSNVEVVTAFNPSGNPVFQRLAQTELLAESQYTTVWKAYVLSLVGNWILELYDDAPTEKMRELDDLLKRTGLRTTDDSAATVFSRIMNAIARLFPSSAEVKMTLSETGIPIIVPKVEFAQSESAAERPAEVPHAQALGLLNDALAEADLQVWVVLDRLDEAFQGFPAVETPALRALFRTYLDLIEFPQIKLKLFVRRDLFRKITQGGFVNLTHVNAKKVEIIWEEEDLLNLLCRRIREAPTLLEDIGVAPDASDHELFNAIFPEKVDDAERKPTTWRWMMTRIRDGNDAKPPRNLIDLVSKAREAQIRRDDREGRDFQRGQKLIEPDSIKRALSRLSGERVEDTLLAEAGDSSALIEKFRGGKAEHNEQTIAKQLGIATPDVKTVIRPLVDLGFLEVVGASYKIPMLYREGLQITQGKAFDSASGI